MCLPYFPAFDMFLCYLGIPDGPVMALEMATSGQKCERGDEGTREVGTKQEKEIATSGQECEQQKIQKKGIATALP